MALGHDQHKTYVGNVEKAMIYPSINALDVLRRTRFF